ncbi:MAG TPA: oligosaccharide flippase family protein [Smithellaceae bacterium]|mgnify:FL=1|nr:oligosaccharide flippase family protein [Smithellaceae bacterium]
MPNQQSQYIKNTLANLLSNAVVVMLFLVTTPFLIRWLGEAQYGLYRVGLVSLVGYSMLLNMGFGTAERRYFSEALHAKRFDEGNEVLSVAYTFHGVQCALVFAVFMTALYWLPPIVNTPPQYLWAFRSVIFASGVYVCCLFLISPLRAIVMSCARYDLNDFSDLAFRAVLLAGGMALIYFWRPSLYALTASCLIGAAVITGLMIRFSRRVYGAMQIRFGRWDASLFRKMFGFGRYAMMMVVGAMALQQSPDVLIAAFLGPQWVASYAVAAILISQLRAIANAFAGPLFPIASRLKAASDAAGLNTLLLEGTRRSLWAWGALVCPVVAFSGDMLSAWVGAQYASSFLLVWILVLGDFGSALHYTSSHILTAVGSIKWLGYSHLTFSAVSIAAMVLILGFTSYGITGVVWALAVPTFIRGGIIVPVYACLQLKIRPWTFYVYNVLPCLLYLAAGIAVCRAVRFWISPVELVPVLAVMALCAGAISLGGLWGMLSKSERRRLFNLVVSIKRNFVG